MMTSTYTEPASVDEAIARNAYEAERATEAEATFVADRRFVTAGKAIFTISHGGQHFTFKVTKKDGQHGNGPVYFVNLLTGPCNTNDYSYVGILDVATAQVILTRKSTVSDDAQSVKVIRWALRQLWSGRPLIAKDGSAVNFQHAGRCGRCARLLTTPESIACGIGPECLGKMGF